MPTFKHPCPHCAKLIERDVRACPFCGVADPFAPARCPTCRAVVDPAWIACPKCGGPLGAKATAPEAAVPSETTTSAPEPPPPVPVAEPPGPSRGAESAQLAAAETRPCAGCGAPLAAGARFCTVCGTLATAG
jgi:RNA polymerase subunit RPABC4/transcription elongation factor Spt4